jgi:hypothetical protein
METHDNANACRAEEAPLSVEQLGQEEEESEEEDDEDGKGRGRSTVSSFKKFKRVTDLNFDT